MYGSALTFDKLSGLTVYDAKLNFGSRHVFSLYRGSHERTPSESRKVSPTEIGRFRERSRLTLS